MDDKRYNELIVFVIRQTGWSLEYVRAIPFDFLMALVEELRYQRAVDNYNMASNFAMVIANWASAMGKRRYRVSDFVGYPPYRREDDDNKETGEPGESNTN